MHQFNKTAGRLPTNLTQSDSLWWVCKIPTQSKGGIQIQGKFAGTCVLGEVGRLSYKWIAFAFLTLTLQSQFQGHDRASAAESARLKKNSPIIKHAKCLATRYRCWKKKASTGYRWYMDVYGTILKDAMCQYVSVMLLVLIQQKPWNIQKGSSKSQKFRWEKPIPPPWGHCLCEGDGLSSWKVSTKWSKNVCFKGKETSRDCYHGSWWIYEANPWALD